MADEPTPRQRPQREQRFEARMSDAEALMWNVEKDPWLNPSGGSLIMLDGPLDLDHFTATLAAAVAEVPRLRERVVPSLGRMSPPRWRPDPEFDLRYHVRNVALPKPSDERQLLDLVSAIYQDPYDRTRPLWMFYVIDGLAGGASAVVWKIHHTVADGTGAGRLAEAFLQPTAHYGEPPAVDLDAIVADSVREDGEASPEGAAGLLDALRDTVGHTARRQAGVARRLLGEVAMWGADPLRARDAAEGIVGTVRSLGGQISRPGGSRPDGELPGGSPLWRTRSRHRRLEILSFSQQDAAASAKGLGGSLNDWFVTGVVNGCVAYHEERGVPLRTLNTSFVVSTRNDRAIGGNSFTPVRFSAPAQSMAPDERFRVIRDAMKERRAGVSRGGGSFGGLAGLANLLPTSVVTSVARSQAAGMDFATSNLRGAKSQLYISGAAVTGNYPYGPLAGTAFNLTTMSYHGSLDMGLFVDPVAVEDPAGLRDHLSAAYDELIALGLG